MICVSKIYIGLPFRPAATHKNSNVNKAQYYRSKETLITVRAKSVIYKKIKLNVFFFMFKVSSEADKVSKALIKRFWKAVANKVSSLKPLTNSLLFSCSVLSDFTLQCYPL